MDFFLSYALEPHLYWPSTHMRNAKKLQHFIKRGCGSADKHEQRRYVEDAFGLARLRLRFPHLHLYLCSAGSSGSHWLEAMLAILPGFKNAGEVYLPKEVREKLSHLPADHKQNFVDALYIIHTGGIRADYLNVSLTNSAHISDPQVMARFSKRSFAIAIFRNPVDIAISRTFRKGEYRNDVARGAADDSYLEQNCKYVENFFVKALKSPFDHVVRYESIAKSPEKTVREITGKLGLEVADETVNQCVTLTSRSAAQEAASKGLPPATNIFLGERRRIRWAEDYARERLAAVASLAGYEL